MDDKTFIETQFPVSKLSKESYKERKAGSGQTLTGLGKWWGRKPLVLVRATILGLLLPSTDNPRKDREIFLKLMTMDEDGLWQRVSKNIPAIEVCNRLPRSQWKPYIQDEFTGKPKFIKGLDAKTKAALQRQAFAAMSYDDKLTYCDRPEQMAGPSPDAWQEINAHLGTHASSLTELVKELGERRFGHAPRVGDAFCGGGSIPFEAARIGCEAYGSDLNPVAALLTWGALNIVGGGPEVAEQVTKAQQAVYAAVDRQITEWGIEHNEKDWRADAYLYCTETRCPECGWLVPLAPSWVIGEKTGTIAELQPDAENQRFHIRVHSGASARNMSAAKQGTVRDSELHCPHCRTTTPISTIRGDRRGVNGREYGLRLWENDDLVPRPEDVFQERLYCIRWVETYQDIDGREYTQRYYRAPDERDLEREQRVLGLLREQFADWQDKGYIPSRRIEPGDKTDEPIRTRGWTHWHHLFNPRQLLVHGLINEKVFNSDCIRIKGISMLGINKCCDWNSRLSRWDLTRDMVQQAFYNQALNTLYNYSTRGVQQVKGLFISNNPALNINSSGNIELADVRSLDFVCDIWMTDPPYADAVNYHELTEFFLAWCSGVIPSVFPNWYTDTKRALAVRGDDESFRKSMVDVYHNLARHMPDNGMQIVMFTHQDAGVWADLALILWAAGLRVTAAWTIATETESSFKKGNYVKATVLLVLRKQLSDDMAFTDEINADIKPEVERQLKSMMELDDKEDPNFSDSDYQLAAYAAALRVITQYKNIEGLDAERELSRVRAKGEKSVFEHMIVNAVKIASNYLIPKLHDNETSRRDIWRNLSAEERFYLKALEVESHGDYRQGVYQEFARGYGLHDYKFLLQSGKANETRLKTATEFKGRSLDTAGFGSSLLRHILFAIAQARETEVVEHGMGWLRTAIQGDYWRQRETIAALLRYLARLPMEHWQADVAMARILAGAVENDGV